MFNRISLNYNLNYYLQYLYSAVRLGYPESYYALIRMLMITLLSILSHKTNN